MEDFLSFLVSLCFCSLANSSFNSSRALLFLLFVDAFNSAAFAASSSSLSSVLKALEVIFLACSDFECVVENDGAFPNLVSLLFCTAGKIYSLFLFDEFIVSTVPFGS